MGWPAYVFVHYMSLSYLCMALLYCVLIVSLYISFYLWLGWCLHFCSVCFGSLFSLLLFTTRLFWLSFTVLSLLVLEQLSTGVLIFSNCFAVSMTGTECTCLLWLVSAWVSFSSCCGCCSKSLRISVRVSIFLSLDSRCVRNCSAVTGVALHVCCSWLSAIQSLLSVLYMISHHGCGHLCLWLFHGSMGLHLLNELLLQTLLVYNYNF